MENQHPRCGRSDRSHLTNGGDLALLILIRLPARTVLRFRCVCRRWLAITTDPSFLRDHTLSHPHPPVHGLIVPIYTPRPTAHGQIRPTYDLQIQVQPIPGRNLFLPDSCLSFMFDLFSPNGLCNSCSGLFLFKSKDDKDEDGLLPSYYVCNPTTRDCSLIPDPPITSIKAMALFFDPSSPVCRTPLLHYKVICIGVNYAQHHVILIYDSLTDLWRLSGKPLSLDVVISSSITSATSCSGAVHWLGLSHHTVSSFLVDTEKLRLIPLPATPEEEDRHVEYFGSSSGDRLHLIVYSGRNIHLLDIFELKEDYSGWLLLYRVNRLRYFKYNLRSLPQPICVLRQVVQREAAAGGSNEEEEEDFLLMRARNLIWFNLQKSSSLSDLEKEWSAEGSVTLFAHSLYPLHHHHHHS